MDQFNKILAGLLVLLVALGIAILVFVRLGLLNRIFKTTQKTSAVNSASGPTPSFTLTPVPQEASKQGAEENNSLFGFLFPRRNSPTSAAPTPKAALPTGASESPANSAAAPPQAEEQKNTPEDVFITIVPYKTTQPTAYPASGNPSALLLFASAALPLGVYLRLKK